MAKKLTKVEKLDPNTDVDALLKAQEEQEERALKLAQAFSNLTANPDFQTALGTIAELKEMIKEECTRPEHPLEVLRWYQAEYAILDNILLRLSFDGTDPNQGATEPADNE